MPPYGGINKDPAKMIYPPPKGAGMISRLGGMIYSFGV